MWLKSLDEIKKYITDDEIYHDIQIINEFIYVDGECQNLSVESFIDEVCIYNTALTASEVKALNKNPTKEILGI